MSVVISFRRSEDPSAHDRFAQWCKTNTGGFFVNLRSPKAAMLHRVGCPHISNWSRDKDGDLASAEKVCGTDEKALRQAVRTRLEASLDMCRTCFRGTGV